MEEMIAAEPRLVEPVLADLDLMRREEEPYRRAAEVAEAGRRAPVRHAS
jgi:hypothetical protein